MKTYYVYILRCSDNSFYTGVTNNIERRVQEHGDGRNPNCYTFKRRPIECVYSAEFREVSDAIAWEKQLKRWSKKKKEAVIRGDYERLPELSKKQFK